MNSSISYTLMPPEELAKIKQGDVIERMLAFKIPCYFTVTDIDDTKIYTGPWTFDKTTGFEIDDDLPGVTPSYIKRILTQDEIINIQKDAYVGF